MSALRAQMPALANKTYFNYGGQGPLPTASLEAIVDTWRRIQELGPFTEDVWPLLGGLSGTLRSRLAQWFGVSPARVAFTENVTSGCVLPLWGLPWSEGEEILLGDRGIQFTLLAWLCTVVVVGLSHRADLLPEGGLQT